MKLTITCDIHGESPCYMVCHHVIDGESPSFIEKAREDFIGQQVCAECEKRTDLLPSDGEIICAGCMAVSSAATA